MTPQLANVYRKIWKAADSDRYNYAIQIADEYIKKAKVYKELVSATENLVIAIGMGWDLEGMIEEVNKSIIKTGYQSVLTSKKKKEKKGDY